MNGIRILIVDTHETVRQGLRTILQLTEDLEVVGEATNGSEAIRLTEELQPEVIIMDMVISIGDRLQAVKEIKHRHPEISVVQLVQCTDTTTRERPSEYGVDAIVEKEAAIHALVDTIRRIGHQKKEKSR